MSSFLRILLVVVWSSALFESGWGVFVESFGVSLFVASALFLVFLAIIISCLSPASIIKLNLSSLDYGILCAILIYISYVILTAIWAPSIENATTAVAELSWYFLVFVCSLLVIGALNANFVSSIIRKVGLVTLSALFFGFLVKVSDAYSGDGWGDDSVSLFRDYNVYSQVLLLSVTTLFVGSCSRGTFQNVFLYVGLVLFVIVVAVISGSRRALMLYGPMAIFCPFLLSLLRCKVRFSLKLSLSILVCVSLASVIYISGAFSSLFNSEISRSERATGFITGEYDKGNRVDRWRNSLELYGEGSLVEMIFGQGVRSYLEDDRFIRPNGDADSPHNFLLSALIEGGIVQVILLIVFGLLASIKLYWVAKRYEFWMANFVLLNFFIWVVGVTISFQGFFDGKIIFLILVVMLSGSNKVVCPSFRSVSAGR